MIMAIKIKPIIFRFSMKNSNKIFEIGKSADLKIIQKAVKETFSEKWSWIYFSFCNFAFHVFNTTKDSI
jgi:hypothetical protein